MCNRLLDRDGFKKVNGFTAPIKHLFRASFQPVMPDIFSSLCCSKSLDEASATSLKAQETSKPNVAQGGAC